MTFHLKVTIDNIELIIVNKERLKFLKKIFDAIINPKIYNYI